MDRIRRNRLSIFKQVSDEFSNGLLLSLMIKIYFRIDEYAVTSTSSSVIYFGGYDGDEGEESDRVVGYKNLKWTPLGNLASPRYGHRSIKMDNKIYIFGGWGTT